MTPPDATLSRTISHALRHEPWLYELELDDEGWVTVENLVTSLRRLGPEWADLQESQVESMIEHSPKRRHELDDHRIRALYGHSLPGRLAKVCGEPPDALFHGTSPSAWEKISVEGLRPMGRQYVHLSVDTATADQVARRKSREPLILVIDAKAAREAGIDFLIGNEAVWLAEAIPLEFISGPDALQASPPIEASTTSQS